MDRKRLAALIRRELDSPGSFPWLLAELGEILPDEAKVLALLEAKDDHHRTTFYLKTQALWMRRFGWRIIRPLFLVAILAAVGFSFQRVVDPTLGVASFLAGAAALHATIQVFAHRWAGRDLDRLPEAEERYRRRLLALLGEIGGAE